MDESRQNGVQNVIEPFARILGQKSQNEVSILLQHCVFPSVASVRFGVSQMLGSIQFHYQTRILAKEVDLHPASGIKGNRQLRVQPEAPGCFRQCFKAPI